MKLICQRYSVVIAGCVRDAARYLPAVLINIERMARMFAQARVVICENDSADRSRDLLSAWQRSTQLEQRVVCRHQPLSGRVPRIAAARNHLLDIISGNGWDDADYLIMMDMDEVCSSVQLSGLASSFSLPVQWDMVGANQRHYYYDFFPLRTEKFNHNPFAPAYRDRWSRGVDLGCWFAPGQYRGQGFPETARPLPVLSCFGGLGIYRMAAIRDLRYRPEPVLAADGSHYVHPETGRPEYECEHVSLHRQMRQAGFDRMYINPAMIIHGIFLR